VDSQYVHPKHPPDKEYHDDGPRDVNYPVASCFRFPKIDHAAMVAGRAGGLISRLRSLPCSANSQRVIAVIASYDSLPLSRPDSGRCGSVIAVLSSRFFLSWSSQKRIAEGIDMPIDHALPNVTQRNERSRQSPVAAVADGKELGYKEEDYRDRQHNLGALGKNDKNESKLTEQRHSWSPVPLPRLPTQAALAGQLGGSLSLFQNRQNVPGRIFEPSNRRAVPARNSTRIGLQIWFVVDFKSHATFIEFIHIFFYAVYGEIQNRESGRLMIG